MYIAGILFLILVLIVITFSFTKIGKSFFDFLNFFANGKDKGFSSSNLFLLWRTSNFVGLEDKTKLFWSVESLDKCIKFIARQVENPINDESQNQMQTILNQLYTYRTKVELETVQKKRSLESSREIFLGQICIILIPNEATVYAKITKNDKAAITLALFDASFERAKNINWNNKVIRVYLWREKDAGYIFQSNSIKSIQHQDHLDIIIRHSNKIIRTQKRNSVRASCKFDALMFPLKENINYNPTYEQSGGVKCIIKDISENGAMFFIKGKAAKGIKMKLQFNIRNIPIVMCGKIVRFIYDKPTNKSRVHFKCELLENKAKNTILSYVYNITQDDSTSFMTSILNEANPNNSSQEINSTTNGEI